MNNYTCTLTDDGVEIALSSEEATLALGRALGKALNRQWEHRSPMRAILMYGDLGSGKTTLTRGLVEALPGGENAEVASPSFTVCNAYPTRPPIVHCDLYRTQPGGGLPEEAENALEDTSRVGSCLLVEWAERLRPEDIPAERLDIRFKSCNESRLALFTPHGVAALWVLQELVR